MKNNEWINIINQINKGKIVNYIVLNDNSKIYARHKIKNNKLSKYYVSISEHAIYFNISNFSNYNLNYTGISKFDIKEVIFN